MCTADEVLHGIDLTGRTAVVTGGYSGVGLAITRALSRAGARVIVPARRPDVARRNLGATAETVEMDLADLTSVRAFTASYLRRHRALDFLIASAAIMACPETRVGPGWEAQFAVNHLGHFALTCGLWPALTRAPAARVVALASGRSPGARTGCGSAAPAARWRSSPASCTWGSRCGSRSSCRTAPKPGRS